MISLADIGLALIAGATALALFGIVCFNPKSEGGSIRPKGDDLPSEKKD